MQLYAECQCHNVKNIYKWVLVDTRNFANRTSSELGTEYLIDIEVESVKYGHCV